jgi:peptidoglycan/xylan/chitin deacetylase (PgdA/CDA1 family)
VKTKEVVIDALLSLFEKYQIPATWATVGHLFLDRCSSVDGVKHPDMPRPTHSWFKQDWYILDPASNIEQDPIWYGRDVVEKIKAAEPRQDIGCHSFSHTIFGDNGCSEKVAEAEIAKCVGLAQEMGIELKSFVFPRSQEGHHHLLSKFGFSCYRASRPGWFNLLEGQAKRVAKLLNDLLVIPPSCAVVEEKIHGLWNISASAYYRPTYGSAKIIPVASRVRQSVRGIAKAISSKGVFHLCLHPCDLAFETESLIGGLDRILRCAYQAKKDGSLDLFSMAQFAEYLESNRR